MISCEYRVVCVAKQGNRAELNGQGAITLCHVAHSCFFGLLPVPLDEDEEDDVSFMCHVAHSPDMIWRVRSEKQVGLISPGC